MQQTNGSVSIAQLLERLSTDIATLVRQEVELAKAELTEKAQSAAAGMVLLLVAAGCALAAGAVLIAAFVLLLSTVMPSWLAAFIVFVVLVTVAAPAGLAGVSRVRRATPLKPERTIAWVKEDLRWLSERTSSAGKSS
jgi:uncharacterized membrane protein YqjE